MHPLRQVGDGLPAGAFQLASRGAKGCLGGQRETWRAKCPPNLLIFWSRGREFWGGRQTHGRKQESVSAGSCLIGGRRTGHRKNRPPNKPWQAQAADARRALGRFVRPGCRRERHRTLPQAPGCRRGPGARGISSAKQTLESPGWRTIDAILAVLFARAVTASPGRSGQKVRPANKSENMKNMDAELALNSP